MGSRGFVAAVLGACLLATSPPAAAQYFGQNKVRYHDLDFQVLKTTHFDIYYYDQEQRVIDEAGQLAERWYARLSEIFRHELRGRQPIVLYASHPEFQETTVIPGFIDPSTGGVTEALQRRVVLPFTGSLEETNHVLGHELVHAFQYDMGGRALAGLPLWFIEGMAEYLSIGPVSAQTAAWLRDASIHDDLPDFGDLDNPKYFPYRFGQAAWAYLGGRFGTGIVRTVFQLASDNGDPLGSIAQVTTIAPEQLSREWHQAIADTYRELDLTSVRARGRALITEEQQGGRLNIGPALSPDGTRLAFLSEKDLFSIDLFLADARTGNVIRKLTKLTTDPHLDNIQFLQSTGAWSSDGRLFAYSGDYQARPLLVIVDAETGDEVRRIRIPEIAEVLNPTWSPDNSQIAFSGISGGTSDLFVYELEPGRLRRLTDDLYAEFQPAWSPDGRTIAFVTDRFSTELSSLEFGNYRIAAYDLASGAMRALPGFENGRNLNPQWAPDGRGFYFIGAPNGIPNVFLARIDTGAIEPVTSLTTAVSGITDTSPAIAVASRTGDLAYTAYIDNNYAIYTLEPGQAMQPVSLANVNAAVLPRQRTGGSPLAQLLRTPQPLPSPAGFDRQEYSPDLSLQYVGAAAQSSLGVSGFGTFVGGGVSLLFGDVLNHHQLGTTIQASGGASDIGAQVAYLNQTSRWNWGGEVQRIPYRTGAFSSGVANVDGRTVGVQQSEIFRQINYEVNGLAEYPFSRSARLEFSGGLQRIGFEHEVTTDLVSLQTGQLLDERTQSLAAPGTLNLARTSGALVFDSAYFGGTGPVVGTRSRLEVAPIFGDLRFTEALLDYRRYVVPIRPLTIAARVMHYGRYGTDSETNQLQSLFIGYPDLVRGYDVNSFSPAECRSDGRSDCPQFDRLLGSRMLVGNVELRVPLPGVFTGSFNYGPVPVEAFVFGDTGVAWTAAVKPAFLNGSRRFSSSVGVGTRVNVFGYFVTEFNAVRPLDRVDNSWQFVFNLRPGF